MTALDPFEMLRELARAERASVVPVADVEGVLAAISSHPRRPWSWVRRQWRRLLAAGAAVLVVVGGGTVAWAVVHRERATSPTMIQCYVEPNLNASSFVVEADGSDPAARCLEAWQITSDGAPRPSSLAACAGATGIAVVFPGDADVCRLLRLPILDPTLSVQDRTLIALQDHLMAALASLGCATPDDVAVIAREGLDAFDLSGWAVTVQPPTVQQPCGRFGLDPVARVIYIDRVPDLFGEQQGG